MTRSAFYIGIISGTSIDAVDCALLQFKDDQPQLSATLSYPYSPSLRQSIFEMCANESNSLKVLGTADVEIGRTFAAAALAILEQEKLQPTDITAIGSHGQTVFHHPLQPTPFTTQLGDPNVIAQLTGITTVADFRRMDMAAGGQGAPLAPLFHQQVFKSDQFDRVIVNVGGIANISILARNIPFIGFDTGPGNVLMDYWINETQQLIYDESGKLASSGSINSKLLDRLLDEDYFQRPAPKSTGREMFNGNWLRSKLAHLGESVNVADIQATLLELTAVTVTDAINKSVKPDGVYVCGGGAYNTRLMSRLSELLPYSEVNSTAAIGFAPDWVEAATFAWLAKQRIEEIRIDARLLTGASRPCVLGGLFLP
ncbi:MAG: anhydro-N-acetylmuramic acid kinase [Pseudohongiellaceae bacterium]